MYLILMKFRKKIWSSLEHPENRHCWSLWFFEKLWRDNEICTTNSNSGDIYIQEITIHTCDGKERWNFIGHYNLYTLLNVTRVLNENRNMILKFVFYCIERECWLIKIITIHLYYYNHTYTCFCNDKTKELYNKLRRISHVILA